MDIVKGRQAVPPGRCASHVVSLERKIEAWVANRKALHLDCKVLNDALKYLGEYRDMLVASDPMFATGADLDRLAAPTPREAGEPDDVFRRRLFGMAAERLLCEGSRDAT